MLQKIIQVGNSAAITIPKSFLGEINGRIGEKVRVEMDAKKMRLLVSWPQAKKSTEVINPEVYQTAKRLLQRYKRAFEALAQK